MTATAVNFYSHDGSEIVCTRTYETRAKARVAIKRARKKKQIAEIADIRTTRDQPTVHH